MEIKVRAWDNHEKRWAKTHEIEGELFINPEVGDTGVFYIHDKSASGKLHYTLVRSTGLHDKNGKEIYEGDIIKECTVGSVIWDGKGVIEECPIGVVKIAPTWTSLGNDKRGRVKLKDGSYSDLFLSKYDGIYEWPDDIEVIGNIYENPELVKIKGEAVGQ